MVEPPHGIAKKKIHASVVFERVAKVGAANSVTRLGPAERRLMLLFVLFAKKLFNFDCRANDEANHGSRRRPLHARRAAEMRIHSSMQSYEHHCEKTGKACAAMTLGLISRPPIGSRGCGPVRLG